MQLGRRLKFITMCSLGVVLLIGLIFLLKLVIKNPSLISPGSR